MSEKTTIILVRHGQTEWNREERFRGRADVPLNTTGLSQAEALGRRIAAEWQVKAIYSSPLSRAVKTGEAIARHFNLSVQIEPGLVDIDYGEWQGLSPEEARQRWPEAISAWYNAPHTARIPGGESLEGLRARTMNSLAALVARHLGEIIVLVGHTVVNRIILLAALGLGNEHFWQLHQDTCAINVLEVEAGYFTLALMNDTCHLKLALT